MFRDFPTRSRARDRTGNTRPPPSLPPPPVCVFGVRISEGFPRATRGRVLRGRPQIFALTFRNVLLPRDPRHSPGRGRISPFPRVDSEDRVLAEGDVGRGSVSGSLDPFKPFHRRFTRLHNAATLIKINYTLARRFALLSLSPSLLAPPLAVAPALPFYPPFLPSSTYLSSSPFSLRQLFSLSPPVAFLHRTFDHPDRVTLPLSPPCSFICTLFEI